MDEEGRLPAPCSSPTNPKMKVSLDRYQLCARLPLGASHSGERSVGEKFPNEKVRKAMPAIYFINQCVHSFVNTEGPIKIKGSLGKTKEHIPPKTKINKRPTELRGNNEVIESMEENV